MPCGNHEDYRNRTIEVPLQKDKDRIKFLEKQNDKLARIACFALKEFEDLNPEYVKAILKDNKEVKKWWKAHKKADAEFELEDK